MAPVSNRDRPRHPLYALVTERANHACEYCLAPEEVAGKEFQVEHVVPRARGGTDDLANLALACHRCNPSKWATQEALDPQSQTRVPLFNPRSDSWDVCLTFELNPADERVRIEGRSPIGRATVECLHMNAAHATRARWKWFFQDALEALFQSATSRDPEA
jgi:hypothetical protein